jgi:trans-2,3-dihydro-3-hydroxyanthranilate isomerase
MSRRFAILDVFTAKPLAGNPLAVVLDGEGLSAEVMQAIAREFNLSETVFVLPPSDPEARARLRIFTPYRELPFAGHPTVGTAVLLGGLDGPGGALVLEQGIGPVRCTAERIDAARGRASFELPLEPVPGDEVENAADIAEALSLTLDDLGGGGFTLARWSAGNRFTFVPVRGLDAIARARPDSTRWEDAFPANLHPAVYVFCCETVHPGHDFHARMFAPAFGVPEDAATGSAVAAFAGMLARTGKLPDGEHRFVVEQGYEMGRPSIIRLDFSLRGGALDAVAISGDAVRVMQGMIDA